ncbi:MAG: hypothetical protein N4A35_12230 [Flavobacteriales bacterium]|jgi:hypothetical protein|nr:hypothetical protein [Flavobacteriales bacterium]
MKEVSLIVVFSLIVGIGFSQANVAIKLLNIGGIEAFDKVELGIDLPSTVEQKITRYIQSEFPVSFKKKTKQMLNPFDPEQLDISVDFWREDMEERQKREQRFGFYYDGFSVRKNTLIATKTSNHLRVRFTPKDQGEWKCKATVLVQGDSLFSDVFSFTVNSPKTAKGFMAIDEQQHYFRIGDSSFFPVGQNIPWPGAIWYNGTEMIRHHEFEQYKHLITAFSERGGNYYRMLITPWTYDVEFENLGNYSSRMKNAWELDRLLEHSEELGLKIHFNMLLHGALENPSVYTITNWDWPAYEDEVYGDKACVAKEDQGYCYRRELGLIDPIAFFTNADAKRFYKNKLRYMIARWGYSTSIGVFELLSEINNLGQQARLEFNGKGCPSVATVTVPYQDSVATVPKAVLQWQHEMAKYIKEELQHDNHPIAVSYTGEPAIDKGDLSYYSPYVDIATYNAYSFDRNQNKYARLINKLHRYRKEKVVVSNSILKKDVSKRAVGLEKPFMLSEIGSGLSACDRSTIWKQSVVLSPFTGLSGVAMPWLNYTDDADLWKYFDFVSGFMQEVDLIHNKWDAKYTVAKSNLVEVYSLQNTKQKQAVGALNNRTYNYYTMRNDCEECFCHKDAVLPELQELKTVVNNRKENALKLTKMGSFKKYKVIFYDPLKGKLINQEEVVKSNWLGQLTIPYPELKGAERPFVYFKVER